MGPLKLLKLKLGSLLPGKKGHRTGCSPVGMKLAIGANMGFGLCSVSNHQALQKCTSLPSSTNSMSAGSITTRTSVNLPPAVKVAAQAPWVSGDCTELVEPFRTGLLKQDPLQSLVEKRDLREEVRTDSVHEQYSFWEEIGSGTYGVVYSAVEVATGMNVAIKKVPTGGLGRRSSFSTVRKEAEVMKTLQDCISAVQYRAFFENEDDVEQAQEGKFSYIAMEYCGGGDLQSLMKEVGPLSEEHAAFVAYEILNLVQQCHKSRILHGDVKAANFAIVSEGHSQMFLNDPKMLRSGWLKGIDFGTCTEVGMGKVTTQMGTPTHWAPEVFASAYKMEADMWSLGVLLYQMISGRLPFCDKEEQMAVKSNNDILHMVCKRHPDFSYGPWLTCSPQVLDFIKGLLMKDTQTRMTADEGLQHPWIRLHMKWQGSDHLSSDSISEELNTWISCFHD